MVAIASRRGARTAAVLALTCMGIIAAGCSSSPSSPRSASGSPSAGATVGGTANVAYAASLTFLNEKVAGPAFAAASGDKYSGQGASSGTLESEIAANAIRPNVFESVGRHNITPPEPKFTKWYIQYAGTQIVVSYNPKSRYASQFKAIAAGTEPLKNLFALMQKPGFKLGRTDPNIDPQGRDFVYMLELAQSYYHLPAGAVTKILGGAPGSASSSQIYAESSLDSTLSSGQLEAASAFITQAVRL